MATQTVTHQPDVPGLTEAQRAFVIEGGHIIVVETTEKQVDEDPRNLTAQHHVAVRVRAWKVETDGKPAVDAQGKPLEIPVKVETILTSALSEGTVSLDNQLVQYTIDALARAKTWLAVKEALRRLPQADGAAR